MTVQRILELCQLRQPAPYPAEVRTEWVNGLEASLWSDVFLMPSGMRRDLVPLEDSQKRLLLPDRWAKLYVSYLAAMVEFTNGEYSRYENSMAMYNGYINELGAWYADTYAPANTPAVWAELGGLAYNNSEVTLSVPAVKGAVVAVECRIDTAFNGGGSIMLGTAEDGAAWMSSADIGTVSAGTYRRTGLILPDGTDGSLKASYSGTGATAGHCTFRVLIQPEARKIRL